MLGCDVSVRRISMNIPLRGEIPGIEVSGACDATRFFCCMSIPESLAVRFASAIIGFLGPNDPVDRAAVIQPTTVPDSAGGSGPTDCSAVAGPFVLYDVKQLIDEVALLRQAVCLLIEVAWNHGHSIAIISDKYPTDVNNPQYSGVIRIHPSFAIKVGVDPAKVPLSAYLPRYSRLSTDESP